jgi:hypothetical protein
MKRFLSFLKRGAIVLLQDRDLGAGNRAGLCKLGTRDLVRGTKLAESAH